MITRKTSLKKEIEFSDSIIDGVIIAKNSNDLLALINKVKAYEFKDDTRSMFLRGLIQGALMRYKKRRIN